MNGVEAMQFRHYPAERLRIESIASRLTPAESAFRMWLMECTINRGVPHNIDDCPGVEPFDAKPLVQSLVGKRAIVLDESGNVTFIYPVSALPTRHRVHLGDGRTFSAMCAIDALGSAFTFKQNTRVESSCSECGEPIHVEIENGQITALRPHTTHVLHVDLNRVDNWAGSC